MNMNFDQLVDKVFDSCKKLTPALVAGACVSGLLLFLPSSIMEKMGLDRIPPIARSVIAIIFILFSVLIVVIILWEFCGHLYKKYQAKVLRKKLRERFIKLPQELKKILITMMKQPDKKMALDGTNGATIYLQNNMFICRPEQVFSVQYDNVMRMQYTPQLWLIDLYYEEPELFHGNQN